MIKKNAIYLFLSLALLSVSGCFFSTAPTKTQFIYDQFGLGFTAGQKMYLKHNIWYKDPMNISSFNYQQGKILPFGTEIKFVEAAYNRNYLVFETVKDGKKYKIVNDPGATMLSNAEIFHQIFTNNNPEKEAAKLPQNVVDTLMQGIIKTGMTRQDVLLALGPPPLNMNPKGTKITWIYFLDDRLKTTHIVFKDDKVSYIFEN